MFEIISTFALCQYSTLKFKCSKTFENVENKGKNSENISFATTARDSDTRIINTLFYCVVSYFLCCGWVFIRW